MQMRPASQFSWQGAKFLSIPDDAPVPVKPRRGRVPERFPPSWARAATVSVPATLVGLPQLGSWFHRLKPLFSSCGAAEPVTAIDSQDNLCGSIRGRSRRVDALALESIHEGAPTPTELLPSNMKGSPTIADLGLNRRRLRNNVGRPTNLGVAPGGGDADIALTRPTPTIPLFRPGPSASERLPRRHRPSQESWRHFLTPPHSWPAQVPPVTTAIWNDASMILPTVYMRSITIWGAFQYRSPIVSYNGVLTTRPVRGRHRRRHPPRSGILVPTDSVKFAAHIKVRRITVLSAARGIFTCAFVAPDNGD